MPMYEYACTGCTHTFVTRRTADERDAAIACPSCGGGHVKRQLATFMIAARPTANANANGNGSCHAADPGAACSPTRGHGFGCACCS